MTQHGKQASLLLDILDCKMLRKLCQLYPCEYWKINLCITLFTILCTSQHPREQHCCALGVCFYSFFALYLQFWAVASSCTAKPQNTFI